MKRCALVLFAALAVAACHEGPTQADSDRSSPLFVIKDAVHSGGNAHFFWLPPLVSNPAISGAFDATLDPEVNIECISTANGTCTASFVAEFTTTTGPGSETVRVSTTPDEYYIVNWHTDEFVVVVPGPTYRISVLVAGTELGFADVQLASTGGAVKNLTTNEIIGLKDGRTLPIKFRIEEGALGDGLDLAFHSFRDGNAEIYVTNVTGTMQQRLTNNPAEDSAPFWSPDGTKIAFTSLRDGNHEIYLMNADGSGQTNLTNNSAVDDQHAWSPDGTRIAFRSSRNGRSQIFVMNADGTSLVQVTDLSTSPSGALSPAWSPDGTRIAYARGNLLAVINADGTGQLVLPTLAIDPSWSPDGTRILFRSFYGSIAGFQIDVINADGTGRINLTNLIPENHLRPRWSPDGTTIAFQAHPIPTRPPEIFVMNADGTGRTNLTNTPTFDQSHVWSPDGTRIAFSARRDGNFEVYVMNSDGTGPTNLTNDPGDDFMFSWR